MSLPKTSGLCIMAASYLALFVIPTCGALHATEPTDYGQSNLSGLVLHISPGDYMVIQARDGSPTVFLDPQACYVNQRGQKIASREIEVGKRVKLSYVQQGPDILVTQVMLTDR